MKISTSNPPDVLVIEPRVFRDDRGFFLESYNKRSFEKLTGVAADFVQDNHSRSRKNVLRGLHYQILQPQGKLVRVTTGEILDVAVDIRRSSPTFGQCATARLSAENMRMVWIPPGFAHGFLVLSESADVLYKTTDYYAPEHERALLWNDPSLAIPWPPANDPIVSEKDRMGVLLKDAEIFD